MAQIPKLAPRARFATPRESSGAFSGPEFSHQSLTRPTPLIRQKIVSGVRRRRVVGASLRVVTLLLSDIAVLLALHVALGEIRQLFQPLAGFGEALIGIAPRGIFPRIEMVSAVLIGLAVFGNYRAGKYRYNAPRLFGGALVGLALVAWTELWYDFAALRALGVALALLGLGISLVLERKLIDVLVARFNARGRAITRAVVLGTEAGAMRVMEMYSRKKDSGLEVVGFLDVDVHPSENALGGISDLVWFVERNKINTIIFADVGDDEMMGDLLEVADDLGCAAYAGWYAFPFHGFVPTVITKRGIPTVGFVRPSLVPHQLVAKRVFDIAIGSLILLAVLPLFAVIAAAIKLDSKGPVFFRAARIGFGGSVFRMFKFRSMVSDADNQRAGLRSSSVYADGRLFKVVEDPRITRVGRFLRRSSLDELPQLWNVVRGEMSLVGPRPPLPDEVAQYEEYHYDRFGMKPGMTGPWQVGGRNTIKDFETVIQLETEYIQSWNIGRDIDILLRTVPAVLSMSGV